MTQPFVVRVERFVRLSMAAAVVNATLLSVLGLAPLVIGPPWSQPDSPLNSTANA